jgi:TonB family protein
MLTALQVAKTMSAICIVQTAIGILAAQDAKPLPSPPSPGQAIQEATRDSAPASVQKKSGNVEILSDTQGVNFGPYLQYMLATVRRNWYSLIPASAQMQKGEVAIEFKILQTGDVKDMQLITSSGSMNLDRAAWGSITGSEPFKSLPEAFTGPYLALRLRYLYNPEKSSLEHGDVLPSRSGSTKLQHATLLDHDADANTIRYPERAKRDKIDGIVRLVARIAPDGTVESVAAVEGNDLLGDAASQAIRKWHFQPATENGEPVEDQVRIRVEFRIDSKAIRFEVFPWQIVTDTNLK